MFISKISDSEQVTAWNIYQPPVDRRDYTIGEITFRPGDSVSILVAGGCVQTGGSGKTWKRYLNPSGPNSDHLYHGLIGFPGTGLMRIADFINAGNNYLVPNISGRDMHLHLGYEDDNYGGNGYWGHDDGTEGQCRLENDGGPAYLVLNVIHA